jgi:hypothetical protein
MGRAPALIALAACHGGHAATDAMIFDAPAAIDAIDAPISCGTGYRFAGRYLDWDSTEAAPCPIAGATWTARDNSSRTATTDATGAFSLCLESYLPFLVVAEPTAPSSCASGSYAMPATAISQPAVFFAGGAFVARAMTADRVTTFYASFGSSFDATRGNLLVHVDGGPRTVSISSASDPPQAFDGAVWAASTVGGDVLFPNIDLGSAMSPQTTVTVTGGAIGTGSVPLAAGAITYIAVVAN